MRTSKCMLFIKLVTAVIVRGRKLGCTYLEDEKTHEDKSIL